MSRVIYEHVYTVVGKARSFDRTHYDVRDTLVFQYGDPEMLLEDSYLQLRLQDLALLDRFEVGKTYMIAIVPVEE
jgi:hypothetical protein